ncbi:class I adenylate cyclase [Marinibactrum halimedae]|uniref:Adenylate cyclase n=1 Tax=Marinibactrum halimedae TaxID=1444977 RepID=A0AA37WN42_9GAMM|nr:class I adenylate cyclase [Marinibactrum halimedae]MCD9458295.1 class I adenylate cyclase [Marinibactrum halimedae]GLS27078.1 adenylate cyclase [Marinibactrum halimedae]
MMQGDSISIADIDNGIDRYQLNRLKERFLHISAERLLRTRAALPERQHIVLDLLCLLFHCNHPAMPGYLTTNTPSGIWNYQPSKTEQQMAKSVCRSFHYHEPIHKDRDIYALFLMGSIGTIAQSSHSDLDIWVCHKPGIAPESIQLLKRKCDEISRWAETYGVELHAFTMDCEQFRSGELARLDSEASGSTQHYLLLDEFYRSAVWLAGRTPLWWYVPPECEQRYAEYANTLLSKKFLRDTDVLDFGSSGNIPAGEFIGAGIWQMYKGIESPYKAVLKLLLLETYASEHPNIRTLSLQFKECVYQGCLELDSLDSYVLLYEHLARYLTQRKEQKRLDLAQRSLYFKVGRTLSKAKTNALNSARERRNATSTHWQTELLKHVVTQWGWKPEFIELLDSRRQWKARRVIQERQRLVSELTNGYRSLTHFAQSSGAESHCDHLELTVLGNKLHAAFERKPGKIERINPDISSNLSEEYLLFEFRSGKNTSASWNVYGLPNRITTPTPLLLLRQSRSLTELICWCHCNGIYTLGTQLLIKNGSITPAILKQLFNELSQQLPPFPIPTDHDQFAQEAYIESIIIIANLNPTTATGTGETHTISDNNDAFCYGDQKLSLISSIDLIVCNSWREVSCHDLGSSALKHLALRLFQVLDECPRGQHPHLHVICAAVDFNHLIKQRINEFIDTILETHERHRGQNQHAQTSSSLFSKNTLAAMAGKQKVSNTTTFVFQTDSHYHCIYLGHDHPSLKSVTTRNALIELLQAPHTGSQRITFDPRACHNDPLRLVATQCSLSGIKLAFFRAQSERVKIYCLDEYNALTLLELPCKNSQTLLLSLNTFIRAVLPKIGTNTLIARRSFGVYPIHIRELTYERQLWKLSKEPFNLVNVPQKTHFNVLALAEPDAFDHVHVDLLCDQHEFNHLQYGENLYLAAAQFILSRRRQGTRYPIYINDLDLTRCSDTLSSTGELRLAHYLQMKATIENKLNHALSAL